MLAGGSALISTIFPPRAAAASSKVPKAQAGYRDAPKGAIRCDRCTQYQPPTGCNIVEGPISPSGSCNFFAARTG